MTDAWIDKYDLARRFGLLDEEGNPRVSGIERKAASGEWPSRKVFRNLRFSPGDVAAIEEMVRHPATVVRREVARQSKSRTRRSASDQPAREKGWGFADLTTRPIRTKRVAGHRPDPA